MDFIPLSLSDPARAGQPAPRLAASDYPLRLELDWGGARSYRRTATVIGGSILVHALAFVLALQLPSFVEPNLPERVVVEHKTPLYFPQELTQKAKNRNKVSQQIDLASLIASQKDQQRQKGSPKASVRHFELPTRVGVAPTNNATPRIMPDAPTLALNQTPDVSAGAPNGLTPAPPPPNTNKTSPLAVAGAQAPLKPVPRPRTPPPPPPGTLRPGLSQENPSAPQPALPGLNGQTGNMRPAIELLSDPQGADFRPYLERVLAIVRANWQRVIPEAVRQNRLHGRSVLQFLINRDGSIARVIVAEPSGVNQLDFAASTSLVMSSPLPQLPPDFKGYQVKLAFTFSYAMPVQ